MVSERWDVPGLQLQLFLLCQDSAAMSGWPNTLDSGSFEDLRNPVNSCWKPLSPVFMLTWEVFSKHTQYGSGTFVNDFSVIRFISDDTINGPAKGGEGHLRTFMRDLFYRYLIPTARKTINMITSEWLCCDWGWTILRVAILSFNIFYIFYKPVIWSSSKHNIPYGDNLFNCEMEDIKWWILFYANQMEPNSSLINNWSHVCHMHWVFF